MEVLIVYMMYKFFHGWNLLTYNKLFVIEKIINGVNSSWTFVNYEHYV
jgi:hypothetical protein